MNRIPSKSRKIKSHTVKRPKISKEHQQRIQKLRQSSTPLRERFREDLMLHKFVGVVLIVRKKSLPSKKLVTTANC